MGGSSQPASCHASEGRTNACVQPSAFALTLRPALPAHPPAVRRLENTLLGLSDSLAVRQACQTLGVHPLCWPREVNGRVRLRHPPWQLTAAGLRAAQEFLASAKPCSTYDGSPERLLQTARSAAGSVPTTKKKASAAKDALVTGLLAAATRAGGLPAAQQRAIDLLTDVVQRLLHPVPERADVEALKVDAAVAVAEFELTFPPTDMAYTGAQLVQPPSTFDVGFCCARCGCCAWSACVACARRPTRSTYSIFNAFNLPEAALVGVPSHDQVSGYDQGRKVGP